MAAVSDASSVAPTSLHHAVHASDSAEGFGPLLKRARESRGLTLQQVASETKIPQRRLEALEHHTVAFAQDDFYLRAEIRAYARAVGADEHLILAHLHRATQPSSIPAPAPDAPVATPLFRSRRLFIVFCVVAMAIFGISMTSPQRMFRRETPARGGDSSQQPVIAQTPQPRENQSSLPPGALSGASPLSSAQIQPSTRDQQVAVKAAPSTGLSTEQRSTLTSVASVSELVVLTEPEGARVTVNGVGWGTAPVTIRHLPGGRKRIRITKDGYKTEDRALHLGDGESRKLEIRLTQIQ